LYKEYAQDDHVYQQKIKVGTSMALGGSGGRQYGTGRLWGAPVWHWGALGATSRALGGFRGAVGGSGRLWGGFWGYWFGTGKVLGLLFMELIERVERRVPLPELLAAFNEPGTSDYLVVYLRLLTSGCLQRHRRFFEQFLEGGRSIKEFCQQVGPLNSLARLCTALARLCTALARPLQGFLRPCVAPTWLSAASHGPCTAFCNLAWPLNGLAGICTALARLCTALARLSAALHSP
uniref:Uncharacterized protein n=1 Tax=Anser cygnoides TaxID=8845 RepID=A0A8B9ENJ1_ANSCY